MQQPSLLQVSQAFSPPAKDDALMHAEPVIHERYHHE